MNTGVANSTASTSGSSKAASSPRSPRWSDSVSTTRQAVPMEITYPPHTNVGPHGQHPTRFGPQHPRPTTANVVARSANAPVSECLGKRARKGGNLHSLVAPRCALPWLNRRSQLAGSSYRGCTRRRGIFLHETGRLLPHRRQGDFSRRNDRDVDTLPVSGLPASPCSARLGRDKAKLIGHGGQCSHHLCVTRPRRSTMYSPRAVGLTRASRWQGWRRYSRWRVWLAFAVASASKTAATSSIAPSLLGTPRRWASTRAAAS